MQRFLSSGGPRRPKFVLRDRADIDRLIVHLVAHRATPRIEVGIDGMSESAVHPLRHRIARLSDSDAGMFGEVLAGVTLLVGIGYLWVASRQWLHLLWLVLGVIAVGLAGKVGESCWRRLRLLWALHRLRREAVALPRLAGPAMQPAARTVPVPIGAHALLDRPSLQPDAFRVTRPVAAPGAALSTAVREDTARHVLLREVPDIDRLLRRVAMFAPLPVIEVCTTVLATAEVHRAQHRIVRRATACNCVFGWLLAGITLMAGGAWLVWSSSGSWTWYEGERWSWTTLWLLVAAACGAGVLGWVSEVVSNRLWLMAELRGLRRRLIAARASSG